MVRTVPARRDVLGECETASVIFEGRWRSPDGVAEGATVEADTYIQAKADLESQVPEGWQLLYIRDATP